MDLATLSARAAAAAHRAGRHARAVELARAALAARDDGDPLRHLIHERLGRYLWAAGDSAAALAASSQAIATTLFIAEKTASVHVSNILAKLGVRSRVEAAALVHRLAALDRA